MREIACMELDFYIKTMINNNIKNNALIFFPVIDLWRVNENYYKIIILKIFKISQFSNQVCALQYTVKWIWGKNTIIILFLT